MQFQLNKKLGFIYLRSQNHLPKQKLGLITIEAKIYLFCFLFFLLSEPNMLSSVSLISTETLRRHWDNIFRNQSSNTELLWNTSEKWLFAGCFQRFLSQHRENFKTLLWPVWVLPACCTCLSVGHAFDSCLLSSLAPICFLVFCHLVTWVCQFFSFAYGF